MTYSELITEVIGRAFPEGYADNLQALYEKRILSGLIELQRWVPYLRQRQIRLYPYTSTSYRQGTTVICRPAGRVKRLSTFASKTLKDVVYYDPCTREDIDRITAQRARMMDYPDAVPTEIGLFNADSSMDKGYRAERGLFCVDKDQIILVPHIESVERIHVEYEGSKTSFEDDDEIDYTPYQEQVLTALENYLRWQSLGKDDRSLSDFEAMGYYWRDSVSSLQLDTKNDTEPDLPMEDIGILPRVFMEASPMNSALACDYDPTNAFFNSLWVMCLDNKKFYNLAVLLIDGSVVEYVTGDGELGGRPEVTFETVRAAILNLKADSDDFYKLVPHIVDGEIVHGFEGDPVDASAASPCSAVAVINIDIQSPDNNNYYRLNLVLQDGVPVISPSLAPAESESPVSVPTSCDANVFILKDVVTQKCMYLRIKDGQISLSDS